VSSFFLLESLCLCVVRVLVQFLCISLFMLWSKRTSSSMSTDHIIAKKKKRVQIIYSIGNSVCPSAVSDSSDRHIAIQIRSLVTRKKGTTISINLCGILSVQSGSISKSKKTDAHDQTSVALLSVTPRSAKTRSLRHRVAGVCPRA
jgi:hypothetical protein